MSKATTFSLRGRGRVRQRAGTAAFSLCEQASPSRASARGGEGGEQLIVGACDTNAHAFKDVDLPAVGFPTLFPILLLFREALLVLGEFVR